MNNIEWKWVFSFLEMDDEDCERRRLQCLDEMSDLEKQFLQLKDKYEYFFLTGLGYVAFHFFDQ